MARTVLDSPQLQLLDVQLLVMASSTEDALRTSIAALAARDAEAANAVIDGDDGIDHQEREIEGLCVKLLLTQQPVATDLHRASAALKIAGDLERIGDQTTDIAEIALTLQGELDGELSAHLREMGDQACSTCMTPPKRSWSATPNALVRRLGKMRRSTRFSKV